MNEEEKKYFKGLIGFTFDSDDIRYIEKIVDKKDKEIERLHSIIKEVRESAKRELKIAEENIKNSEQWLDVEEEQEHAKRDIHTGKIVKRYMEMFLEILDKGVN